jgi:hypothetical protein
MAVTSATLRKLAALELSAQQMAGVLEILADQQEAEEARLASQRDRKARQRSGQSRDSHGTVTGRDCDLPPPPKESPQTPKETPPTTLKEKTPKGVQKKGSRLPADFEPDFGFALSQGLTRSQAQAEFAKFRDYWAAKSGQGATKQDWQATWRNWVRTAAERLLPRNRAGPGGKPSPIDHFRNLASELNGQDRDDAGPTGHRDDAPGIPVRAIEHHG